MRLRLAAMALASFAGAAAAQRPTAELAITLEEHRVNAGTGREVASGLVFGAGLATTFAHRFHARLEAQAGHLGAEEDGGADRDVGEMRGALGFEVLPWLSAEVALSTRMYSAPIARQRWTAWSLAAEARLPFSGGRFVALGRGAWMPLVSVTDLDAPTAIAAAAGVEYGGSRGRVVLWYGVERYDFPAVLGFARRERVAQLTLRVEWSPTAKRR